MTALRLTLFLPSGLFLIFLAATPAHAQTTFGPQHVISTATDGARSVFAASIPGRLELGVFAGLAIFDDALISDRSVIGGLRLGFRIAPPVVLETEVALVIGTDDGDMAASGQLWGNGRFEFNPRGQVVPFVTGGAGYVGFDRGNRDEAFGLQSGAGLIFLPSSNIGLRDDARVILLGDVFNEGTTANFQVTGGALIRL